LTFVACANNSPDDVQMSAENEPIISEMHAFWPRYENLESLTLYSADVIRGEVLSERVERINVWCPDTPIPPEVDPYAVVTLHQVRILEVFQGSTQPGDIMDVFQRGGALDGSMWINHDMVSMAPGDDLVLFLHRIDDLLLASLMHPAQSIYRFPTSGDGIMALSADQELESVLPENGLAEEFQLRLTVEDLLRISEGTLRNR